MDGVEIIEIFVKQNKNNNNKKGKKVGVAAAI